MKKGEGLKEKRPVGSLLCDGENNFLWIIKLVFLSFDEPSSTEFSKELFPKV